MGSSNDERAIEYRTMLMKIGLAARMLAGLELEESLTAISFSDSAGPILDPTAYKANSKAMHEDRELIEAALPLARIGQKLLERLPEAECSGGDT